MTTTYVNWVPGLPTRRLRRVVLVVAFEGWFDAAGSATGAAKHLCAMAGATKVGTIDGEEFVDYRTHRPHARWSEDEGRRVVDWPDPSLWLVPFEGNNGRDLVVVRGPEPDYQWRTFVNELLELSDEVGAELIVSIGSGPARSSHTRPPEVTASAASIELTHALGLSLPSYQGITGVVGVLQQAMGEQGHPGVSLRVGVPYYAGSAGFPPGTKALLAKLGTLLGIDARPSELDAEIAEWRVGIDAAVAEHDSLPAEIRRLENEHDMAASPDAAQLVEELEQYLRARRDDDDTT